MTHVLNGCYVVSLSNVQEFLIGLSNWVEGIINEIDEVKQNELGAMLNSFLSWLVSASTPFDSSTMQTTIRSLIYTHCRRFCRNINLGLTTKIRVKKEGDLGGTSYTPESAGECERMNPHTPKATPTWGVGLPKDSQIFKERLQGSKPIGLKSSLYHWKAIET